VSNGSFGLMRHQSRSPVQVDVADRFESQMSATPTHSFASTYEARLFGRALVPCDESGPPHDNLQRTWLEALSDFKRPKTTHKAEGSARRVFLSVTLR
jgi:hypothetical protein